MRIWGWQHQSPVPLERVTLDKERPTVIICGGSFNVENPAECLQHESPPVKKFFDFILQHVAADRQTFKTLIGGPLEGKLQLNYFTVRKLLGIISAIPGEPEYPESLAGGADGEVDILEIAYTSTQISLENVYKSYESGGFFGKDAEAFVRLIFGPLIETHKNDIESLCRQLSRIALLGISYGSHFLIEVENAFCAALLQAGYEAAQQEKILKSVFAVAMSSTANIKGAISGPRFTAVYFEGTNDKLAAWINPYKTPAQAGEDFRILPLSERRMLVLLPVTVTATRWIEVLPQWDYYWLDHDKAAHYTPFYTMRCEPENFQPELLERVLRNAVNRHHTPMHAITEVFRSALPFNARVKEYTAQKEKVDALLASACGKVLSA